MSHSLTDDDYKNRAAVYILISAHKDVRGLDEHALNQMAARYLRELRKCGVSMPEWYPNIVNGEYPEIHDAIINAISYDWLAVRMNGNRLDVRTNFQYFLARQTDFTPEEVLLALEAANIAINKFNARELDDDLENAATE